MEILITFMVFGLAFLFGPFISYVLVAWGAQAYFEEKLKYHKKLLHTIETGDKEHG